MIEIYGTNLEGTDGKVYKVAEYESLNPTVAVLWGDGSQELLTTSFVKGEARWYEGDTVTVLPEEGTSEALSEALEKLGADVAMCAVNESEPYIRRTAGNDGPTCAYFWSDGTVTVVRRDKFVGNPLAAVVVRKFLGKLDNYYDVIYKRLEDCGYFDPSWWEDTAGTGLSRDRWRKLYLQGHSLPPIHEPL